MNNDKNNMVFNLFANCIPVAGPARATICDLQRGTFEFIPLSLYEILQDHGNKTFAEITSHYGDENTELLNEYFNFLIDKEFGFWCSPTEKEMFPPISLEWENPFAISNAIIDINDKSNHPYEKIWNELSDLGCEHIQLRCYSIKTVDWFSKILKPIQGKRIKTIEIITPYFSTSTLIEDCKKLIYEFNHITSITLHSSPKNDEYPVNNLWAKIYTIEQKIDSHAHCGIIHPHYFNVNLNLFAESQKHNTCLNKKIAIGVDGNIRNCPSMNDHYGSIHTSSFAEILQKKGFKDLWGISKSQINTCNICEFRHICTDCRAFLQDPNDKLSKPFKCNYNPHTAEWEN